jgi:ClpP class serine protease
MDPISLALITAVGVGVTSSVTDATKASLVAGYTALKTRLVEKIGRMHPKVQEALAELEAAPTSQARQAVLVEEITATDLPHDRELLDLAQTLLRDIQQIAPGTQIIHHIQNSAVSNSGTANNYNIQGDQYLKP